MESIKSRLVLTIDTRKPIELREFVGLFVGLGNQFELHYAREHGVVRGTAKFYVQEIRKGSIIAELTPYIVPGGVLAGGALAGIKHANDLISFVKNVRSGISSLTKPKGRLANPTKGELSDYLKTVRSVAHDSNGSLSLAVYEDDDRRIAFEFDTQQARMAEANLIEQGLELERTDQADYERMLMVFTRTNVEHATTGKRSGELVEIEALHKKPLPIVYASKLAEERIRHEIAGTDENVYKKAFDVDVNVEMRGDMPIAYRLVAVHNVIDLPEEE